MQKNLRPNLMGRTYKLISWLLFSGDPKVKEQILKYAEHTIKNTEVKAGKEGITVGFKKEF